jgi:uncharacterized protein (TIGR03437 family)
MRGFRLAVLGCAAASAFAQIPASYNYVFLDVPGATSTQINSINDRGDIVGTYLTADLNGHVFLRPAGSSTIITIAAPDGKPAGSPVINSLGQIAFVSGSTTVGGFFNDTTSTVYLRSADGQQITALTGTLHEDAITKGINDRGQVIGYGLTPGTPFPILLNPDGSIPAIKLTRLVNFGINNAGQVMWAGNFPFPAVNGAAFLDNPDGTASGKRLDLPSYLSNAAMSNNGLVAGTFEQANLGRGFVGDLSSNTFAFLDAPGYQGQTQVSGVNDFGVAVGAVGSYPKQHGFIATPVIGAPAVSPGGVTNAASYANGAVSPGEIVVLFGTGMAPPALTLASFDDAGFAATTVLTARVLFDGVPAPLIYVRGDQVCVQVPYEATGATTSLQVEYLGQRSSPVAIPVTPAVPGIFTIDGSGAGPAVVLNQDNSINTAINPARRGDIIVFYVTGTGQTLPASVTGKVTPLKLNGFIMQQPLPITVLIGNGKGLITYDAAAPGLIAGVSQINVLIPADAPIGATVPLTIQVGSATSRSGVTVAVK